MRYYQKQTHQNNHTDLIITACVAITVLALVFALQQHQNADMAVYAAQHNCSWHDNGTLYGDNRDHTCK